MQLVHPKREFTVETKNCQKKIGERKRERDFGKKKIEYLIVTYLIMEYLIDHLIF